MNHEAESNPSHPGDLSMYVSAPAFETRSKALICKSLGQFSWPDTTALNAANQYASAQPS